MPGPPTVHAEKGLGPDTLSDAATAEAVAVSIKALAVANVAVIRLFIRGPIQDREKIGDPKLVRLRSAVEA